MMDFEQVTDRLKKYFGITKDTELAEKIGIKQGNFANYKTRGSIPYEQIVIALDKTDADLQWIFYGVETEKNRVKTAFIQFYSYENTSDGDGNLNCSGDYEMVQIDSSLFKNINIQSAVAIRTTNISMAPSINEDDIVLVDRSIRNIISGKIYIVDIKGMVIITRIFKMPDCMILRPDNINFPEQMLQENEFTVLGKVMYRTESL